MLKYVHVFKEFVEITKVSEFRHNVADLLERRYVILEFFAVFASISERHIRINHTEYKSANVIVSLLFLYGFIS